MIGQIIGSFKIVRFIKSGGMADVYEGQEINIGKKVAIKVLKSNFQNEKEIVNRFFKEGSVLEQLAHPNIVRVLYTTEHMGCPVMIMEYLNGEDLNDHLANNAPLDIAIIESFFLQILDAVIYAHSQNVLHRDIKPSNIFITQTKQIKILDFGIAKILDSNAENTQTGFGMYTPMYMSPEQARAEKNLTAHTDIYSLGVTLYTIAAGENPYQGLSQYEIGNKILNEPLPKLSGYPDSFNQVIAKATEKNKEHRYQTALEFKNAFETALKVNGGQTIKTKEKEQIQSPTNDKRGNIDEVGKGGYSPLTIALIIFSCFLLAGMLFMNMKYTGKKNGRQVTTTVEEPVTPDVEDDEGFYGTIVLGRDDNNKDSTKVEKVKNETIIKKEPPEPPKNKPKLEKQKNENYDKSNNSDKDVNNEAKTEVNSTNNSYSNNTSTKTVTLDKNFKPKFSDSRVWKEACDYIKRLNTDLNDLTPGELRYLNPTLRNDQIKPGVILKVRP